MAIYQDDGTGGGFTRQWKRVWKRNAAGEWEEWEQAWVWDQAAYDAATGTEADKIAAGWKLIFGGRPGKSFFRVDEFSFDLVDLYDRITPASASVEDDFGFDLVDIALHRNRTLALTDELGFDLEDLALARPVFRETTDEFGFDLEDLILPEDKAEPLSDAFGFDLVDFRPGAEPAPTIEGPTHIQLFPGQRLEEQYRLDSGVPPRDVLDRDLEPWMRFTKIDNRTAGLSGRAPGNAVVGTRHDIALGVLDSANPEPRDRFISVIVEIVEFEFDIVGPSDLYVALGAELPATEFTSVNGASPYVMGATGLQAFSFTQIGAVGTLSGPLWANAAIGDTRVVTINSTDADGESTSHAVTVHVTPAPFTLTGETTITVVEGDDWPDPTYAASGGLDTAAYEDATLVQPEGVSLFSVATTGAQKDTTTLGFSGSTAGRAGESYQLRISQQDTDRPPNADAVDVTVRFIEEGTPFSAELGNDFSTDPGVTSPPQALTLVPTGVEATHRLTSDDPAWGEQIIDGANVSVRADATAPRGSEHTVEGESTRTSDGSTDTWSAKWTVPHIAFDATVEPDALTILPDTDADTTITGQYGVPGESFGFERLTSDPPWATVTSGSATSSANEASIVVNVAVAAGTAHTVADHTERWKATRGDEEETVEFTVSVGRPDPVLSLPDFSLPPNTTETLPFVIEHEDGGSIRKTTDDPTGPGAATVLINLEAKTVTVRSHATAVPGGSGAYAAEYTRADGRKSDDDATISIEYNPISIGGDRAICVYPSGSQAFEFPIEGGSGSYRNATASIDSDDFEVTAEVDLSNNFVLRVDPLNNPAVLTRARVTLNVEDDTGARADPTGKNVTVNYAPVTMGDVEVLAEDGGDYGFDFGAVTAGGSGTRAFAIVGSTDYDYTLDAATGSGTLSVDGDTTDGRHVVGTFKVTDAYAGCGENSDTARLILVFGDPFAFDPPTPLIAPSYGDGVSIPRLEAHTSGGVKPYRYEHRDGVGDLRGRPPSHSLTFGNVTGPRRAVIRALDSTQPTPQRIDKEIRAAIGPVTARQLLHYISIDSDGFIPMDILGYSRPNQKLNFRVPGATPTFNRVIGIAPGGENLIARKTNPQDSGQPSFSNVGRRIDFDVDIVDVTDTSDLRNAPKVGEYSGWYLISPWFGVQDRIGCKRGTTCTIVIGTLPQTIAKYENEFMVNIRLSGGGTVPPWVTLGGLFTRNPDGSITGTGLAARTITIAPPPGVVLGNYNLEVSVSGAFDVLTEIVNPDTGEITFETTKTQVAFRTDSGDGTANVSIGVIEVDPIKISCSFNSVSMNQVPNPVSFPNRRFVFATATSQFQDAELRCDQPTGGFDLTSLFGATGGLKVLQTIERLLAPAILRGFLPRTVHVPGPGIQTVKQVFVGVARGNFSWQAAFEIYIEMRVSDTDLFQFPVECVASDTWSLDKCISTLLFVRSE